MNAIVPSLDCLSSTYSLQAMDGRYHVLRLSGLLLAGWEGRLATALSARRISILRASTCRAPSGSLAVEIKVEALDPSLDLSAIDFFNFTRDHGGPPPAAYVELTGYRLTCGPGSVKVGIRAVDAEGFLGRMLRVFARFGLFPSEMIVDTQGSEIVNVFSLQSKRLGAHRERPRPT